MVGVLEETYLFYSSLTLFVMGCLTFVLFILFRLKHHRMNSLPRNLSANVFNKTFNVFDPYPERRRIIHSFLSALPLVVFFVGLFFTLILWKIFEYGLLLSLVTLIICLHLMLVDFASGTYQSAKILVKAVDAKAGLGVGDLEVFQKLKRVMPKLSNYYLALSILFSIFAVTLSYIWSSLLWVFVHFVGLIFKVFFNIYGEKSTNIYGDVVTGFIAFQVAVVLWGVTVFIIQIFAWKIKSKVLSYIIGSK